MGLTRLEPLISGVRAFAEYEVTVGLLFKLSYLAAVPLLELVALVLRNALELVLRRLFARWGYHRQILVPGVDRRLPLVKF